MSYAGRRPPVGRTRARRRTPALTSPRPRWSSGIGVGSMDGDALDRLVDLLARLPELVPEVVRWVPGWVGEIRTLAIRLEAGETDAPTMLRPLDLLQGQLRA